MAVIEVIVKDQNDKPVEGAEITYSWNFLGFPQEAKGLTDSAGKESFDNGASSARIEIKASKGGVYSATTFVEVGLFGIGVTPANPQILKLKFDPVKPVTDSIEKVLESFGNNAKIIIIAVGIPAGLLATYLIYKWITTGKFIGTAKVVYKELPKPKIGVAK
jgi:hypothetical protein